MELKIVENPKHTKISEALGMTDATFDAILRPMSKYFSLATVNHLTKEHTEGHKCHGQSKTKKLSDFLASKEFKAAKWTPKTANDYFMLGFIFISALQLEDDMIKGALRKATGEGVAEKTIELGHGITIKLG